MSGSASNDPRPDGPAEGFVVHIVDGTYELFRQYFARPEHINGDGLDVGAVRAVVRGMLAMLEEGATHLGVATDQVIESFRNELYAGYKTGEAMEPGIKAQFAPLEDALMAAGIATYPMVAHEADDGMASLARIAAADGRVTKILICTPDKDLAQCVTDGGTDDDGLWHPPIIQFDRRKNVMYDEAGVIEKYGIPPASIPDWLGLVGDSADGFPGLKGWGAKSAAAVLTRYGHIDQIPLAAGQWDITVRSGATLAKTLADNLDDALLFRRIATLEHDAPTAASIDELRWTGPADNLAEAAALLDAPDLLERTAKLAAVRGDKS